MKNHLEFSKQNIKSHKHDVYCVFNLDDDHLGDITYNPLWQCHVWEQYSGIIMSKSCLDELSAFMKKLDDKL